MSTRSKILNETMCLALSSTRPEVLRGLVNHENRNVLARLAMNLNTPTDVLDTLAMHSYTWIRINVAWHRSASPETLRLLSKQKAGKDAWQVRRAVANNPNTTSPDLFRLIRDRAYQVQDAAARNPHAPYGAWARKYRVLP